ncbi:MAG TPA: outer membrane protein assembly factor BamA [Candidatus Limnocylindria bacterium]|nr:outer membrane protein assembly factor BamA [Candidatus Limnocylindria bacterium]
MASSRPEARSASPGATTSSTSFRRCLRCPFPLRWRPALNALALLAVLAGAVPAAAQTLPPFGRPDTTLSAPVPERVAGDESATPETQTVGRVSVAGNVFTDSSRIVRTFEVPVGARFSADAVRRGIRKLFALGLFEDAWVQKVERGPVVDLVIHVVERPRIAKLEFTGNRKRETSELEKKLFLKVGEPYAPGPVQNQVDTLLTYYRDEGFARAAITAELDTTAGERRVGVRFVVNEGEKVRIRRIELRGVSAFEPKKLKKQLKTKAKGFFGGGEVADERFTEDIEKLEAYYQNRGYRDAQVTGHELLTQSDPRKLTLVFTLQEGPRYRIGDVSWAGNAVLTTETLQKFWTPKIGEVYDRSRIDKARGDAYAEYAERGYLYLGIEPKETVGESLVVDVAYAIGEGQPSNVRMIHITGNRNTREKVIRREIDIHEGDRFKRSALVRSQGDVFRLGLFEDVQIDFQPADSTDVDITLTVKEKSVGTASAGAGYTEEGGVTGFLELGHNNVLGNGQSVALHLERGARRSDYSLSFTEPWFRDTPTLLGFSLFNTERQRDLFDEKRRGGSVRVGRPLPWPDYSRGSVGYRLEDVTIRQTGDVITPQDSIALVGVPVGEALRTSSLESSFLRNSTDNPFYPTRGTKLAINTELAGGPFGGSVSFHKHRIEGRWYAPSLMKGVTTMLRGRIGLLGEYGDQVHSSAPPYERFRLGGGTTPDPVRGYDDYMIVPSKFIQDVIVAYDTTRSGPDSGLVTPRTQKVRYPGGRFMSVYTIEQQFPIVHPLHGVLFFDAGNTWDLWDEIRPLDLKMGAGLGFRLEIPLLGNIGFDYGYGFNRDDGPKAVGHFLIGQTSF